MLMQDKECSAYSVCAQAAVMLWTCNIADRLLVNVMPKILIVCTRCSSGILSLIGNFVFRLWTGNSVFMTVIDVVDCCWGFTMLCTQTILNVCLMQNKDGISNFFAVFYHLPVHVNWSVNICVLTCCGVQGSPSYDTDWSEKYWRHFKFWWISRHWLKVA